MEITAEASAQPVMTKVRLREGRGTDVGKTEAKRKHHSGSSEAETKAQRAQTMPQELLAYADTRPLLRVHAPRVRARYAKARFAKPAGCDRQTATLRTACDAAVSTRTVRASVIRRVGLPVLELSGFLPSRER